MNIRIAMALVVLIAPPLLHAEDEEESSPWAGKVTLGYLATSGNTENSTLNAGFEISYTSGNWVHLAEAFAISASESKVTSAEAYKLGWKSERMLSDHNFLFARLSGRKDRFSAYATQFSQTLGYGHRLIDNKAHKLNAEIGAGARQSELQDGTGENEAVFRGGIDYTWQFSETAEFRQDLMVEVGGKNTYSESKTAISARLVGNLALVASYTIRHNSDVPALTENSDRYTALSLEYLF